MYPNSRPFILLLVFSFNFFPTPFWRWLFLLVWIESSETSSEKPAPLEKEIRILISETRSPPAVKRPDLFGGGQWYQNP